MSETVNTESGFATSVVIADDVIRSIAILAAADVRGVAGIAGIACDEIKAAAPGKYSFKGVKCGIDGDNVALTLPITAQYGTSLPKVSKSVQDKIAEVIENMTGLDVVEVNVNITGIELP